MYLHSANLSELALFICSMCVTFNKNAIAEKQAIFFFSSRTVAPHQSVTSKGDKLCAAFAAEVLVPNKRHIAVCTDVCCCEIVAQIGVKDDVSSSIAHHQQQHTLTPFMSDELQICNSLSAS